MKVFYHRDLDGMCSAAIINYCVDKEVELFDINYGEEFPWEKIAGEMTVWMVDFCLPMDDMIRLNQITDLIWIDHHQSSIDEAKKAEFDCKGVRRVGIGACQIVWEAYNGIKVDCPRAVKHISQYDVWDHSETNTESFYTGLMSHEGHCDPKNELWNILFTGGKFEHLLYNRICRDGEPVLRYQKQTNGIVLKEGAFVTEFEGYRAICCNHGVPGAGVFEYIDHKKYQYDLMIVFKRSARRTWTVGVYTARKNIDCSELCKRYNGGGHREAAGFECSYLPFEI